MRCIVRAPYVRKKKENNQSNLLTVHLWSVKHGNVFLLGSDLVNTFLNTYSQTMYAYNLHFQPQLYIATRILILSLRNKEAIQTH